MLLEQIMADLAEAMPAAAENSDAAAENSDAAAENSDAAAAENEEPEDEAEPEEPEDEPVLCGAIWCKECQVMVNGPAQWDDHKQQKVHKNQVLRLLEASLKARADF